MAKKRFSSCAEDRARLLEIGQKRCSVCAGAKPLEQFSKRAPSPDGLSYKCRECYAEYARQWKVEHPDAFKQWAETRKEDLSEKFAAWRVQNKDTRAAYMANWGKANVAKVAAKNARRHAIKVSATPAWANHAAIEAIYARAAELTKLTGVPHEVDHFYPLQGKRVCGLHCEANLQILTQFENISKLNRMPDEWAGTRDTTNSGALSA